MDIITYVEIKALNLSRFKYFIEKGR